MAARIGIFGLSGCWGEQIVMLNCEDELPALFGAVEIVDFAAASTGGDRDGPLDVAFVEGSVGSARDEESLRRIRSRASRVVACGSCACFGGVAARRSGPAPEELATRVYGPEAARYDVRPHRPLHDVVKVDACLPGCPIEKEEFLSAVASLARDDLPVLADHPVCLECRIREADCLLIARGLPCAGPVTTAGCGARCPGLGAPCVGCRGPTAEPNFESIHEALASRGLPDDEIGRRLTAFAPQPLSGAVPEDKP